MLPPGALINVFQANQGTGGYVVSMPAVQYKCGTGSVSTLLAC